MNDISIIWGIVTVFVLIGVLLPFINEAYGVDSGTMDVDNLETSVGEDIESASAISVFTVLFSVLKMFFWTFGELYFWLDMVFVIFRIMLALIIARNVWIGGGA